LNYRHVLDDLWYPGTASKYATSSFRWLREIMWPDTAYEEMSQAASDVPAGCEGLLFLPHLEGEWVPVWDDKYRAGFLGATVRHKRPHFTRAVMEGVAFAIRAGVEYMQDNGIQFDQIRLIGRGSTSDLWAQIMTDVLNEEIYIPDGTDAAYGAALLTGMGVGLYPMESERLAEMIQVREIRTPDRETASLYGDLYEIYRNADQILAGIWRQLFDLGSQNRKIESQVPDYSK
jgi:xylulokinase